MNSTSLKDATVKLNKGQLDQIYLVMGDDYFLQEYFIKKLEQAIFVKEKPNRELLMPDDLGQKEIIDRLIQSDLFSSKKLFMLRNPQLVKGKSLDELIQFCKEPQPNHSLVIIFDDFYSSLKIAKELQKIVAPIDARKPFENKLNAWAKQFFNDEGIDAPPSVIQAVMDIAGDSVYHIANQVEKICLGLTVDDELTPEFVEKFSGWEKTYQMWELLNAIGGKDIASSLVKGREYISRNSMISLLPSLTALYQEMLFIKMNNGTSKPFMGYIPLTSGVKRKLPGHASKYTQKEIEQCLFLLGKVDRRIKTTSENDESLLTYFLFNAIGDHG